LATGEDHDAHLAISDQFVASTGVDRFFVGAQARAVNYSVLLDCVKCSVSSAFWLFSAIFD